MDQLAVAVSEEKTTTPAPKDTASSAKSAAINALKFTLQHLGKAPLPGIGAVASAILDVINRSQVNQESLPKKNLLISCTNLATVDKELKKLTTRMASLGYLARNVDKIDGSTVLVERLMG
jgi:hypothetical protein